MDLNGFPQLTNRPLTCMLQILENERIPTNIERTLTYAAAEGYYLDLLSCHDNRIRHQPNSMHDEDDGRIQMAYSTIMRALLPHFTSRDSRHGPFVFRLTDLHQSNILVDEEWHIKCLVDLEWACSLPIETLRPPQWIIDYNEPPADQGTDDFSKRHEEFMKVFEEEEKLSPAKLGVALRRTNMMRNGWKIGNFWYFEALYSPQELYYLFRKHIQPIFSPSEPTDGQFGRIVSDYWAADVKDVIGTKLRDKEIYEETLRKTFQDAIDKTLEDGTSNIAEGANSES